MLRSTSPDRSLASLLSPRSFRAAAAPLGLCALLYASALHAQAAPPPPPPQGGAAPAPTPMPPPPPPQATAPAMQPPPAQPGQPGQPGPAPGQPGAAPAQPGQPGYAPPGYGGYPPPYGQPPYGYPQSPYPPGPYYGSPYFYDQPPPAPPPTVRANPLMMGFGVTAVILGGIGFLSSLAALATANNRIDVYCDGGVRCAQRDDTDLQLTGGVLMGISGAVLIAGIPLWVIGGKKIPLNNPSDAAPDKPAASTSFQPVLHVGPTSASLSVSF